MARIFDIIEYPNEMESENRPSLPGQYNGW